MNNKIIKETIIKLVEKGCSRQQISSELEIPLKAVQCIVDRFKNRKKENNGKDLS